MISMGAVGRSFSNAAAGFLVFALLQEQNGSLELLEGRTICRMGLSARLGGGGRSFFAAGSRGSGLLRHFFAMSADSRTRASAARRQQKPCSGRNAAQAPFIRTTRKSVNGPEHWM
jgi:hypothetical protein